MLREAEECIALCRKLALHSEEPGFTTRTFLSEPMRGVHRDLRGLLANSYIDAAGNLRSASTSNQPTLYIGSHLDTVPHAGAFDGILGVVLAIQLAKLYQPRRFQIEVVGFSEEEGVRFGVPFIGSLGMIGELDESILSRSDANGISVASAISAFGLDSNESGKVASGLGYLEFHIEQGPVLESLHLPLGIVDAISGQTRREVTFVGRAGHAGTTPMRLRRDALAGAAEWIGWAEQHALQVGDLVATVGRIDAQPGAPNVIPGVAKLSLDVRHREDRIRMDAVSCFLAAAKAIAERRELVVTSELRLEQAAVAMDSGLSDLLANAVTRAGYEPHRMASGAGHDAMILARRMPAAMLFLRSPDGLSHHPDESVSKEDVAAALSVGMSFLEEMEQHA